MEAFPCTEAEWEPVQDAAEAILDADSAGDDVLKASLHLEMIDLLAGLRERYGDHPVLLETMADYLEDAAERAPLYRRAVEIAEVHGLPTLSIRRSFARLLVDIGEPVAALEELHACGNEAACGNEDERTDWADMLEDVAYDTEGDDERIPLYRRAMEIAAAHGQPTLRIRLLLVRFLLDMGELAAAREELRACRGDVPGADEDDRTWWAGLLAEANSV